MTSRDRLLIVGLAVIAVIGGFWMLAMGPGRAESGRLDTQLTAARKALADAGRKTAAARLAQRSYGADAAAIATLGKALPTDDQTASLLYQLDAAAGQSKVKLTSISPTVATAGTPAAAGAPATGLPAGVTEVSLLLSFEGRFADLQRFLRRVQDYTSVHGDSISVHGRLLSVQGLSLTADGSGAGRVQASVTASAYTATAAPAAGAAGATSPQAPATTASASSPPTQSAMVGAGG